MLSPTARFKNNLEIATGIKIEPDVWFSPPLANYIHQVASYHQVDAHALCISLINVVATTCRNSTIIRRNNQMTGSITKVRDNVKVPLNLYNLVVGRAGQYRSRLLH
ncbi:unnamed protein product [Sphagnum troendelagicum]